jgi:hypothetical protein
VLVNIEHGKQGRVAKQPARAEPEVSSMSLETGELPQGGAAEAAAAAAAAEARDAMVSDMGPARQLSAPLLPLPVAQGVLQRKWSGRIPAAAAAPAGDADMAWLESAVADVLHPGDEQQQQQQQEGGALSRDRSSVWGRLGGAFGHPGQAQEGTGPPKAAVAAAAAAARSPSPALAGRLPPELQLPLQRNRSKELLPSPALASRLQQVPSPKQPQHLPSIPQLAPETIDLLDLAIVEAFAEWRQRRYAYAEARPLPETHGGRQPLQQQDAEMPLEVRNAGSVPCGAATLHAWLLCS